MSTANYKFVEAARSHLGSPFKSHFEPEDTCAGGTITRDDCMERGMGAQGEFDCSGLVIASLCEVLGISSAQWPPEYRHAKQLVTLEEHLRSKVGDIAAFYQAKSTSIHLGVLVASNTVIHASGRTKVVEEGKVAGKFSRIGIIPVEKLLELGLKETL